MERLTQILSMLSAAERRTLPADRILQVVSYGADSIEDRRDQLRRDIRHLESLGWEISNVAPDGEPARYRLVAIDNRLRVEFTPEQRAQLVRAAYAARLDALVDDLGGDPDEPPSDPEVVLRQEPSGLALAHRAVSRHCLLRFRYKDKDRVVHPQGLHIRLGGWYLTALEDEVAKTFAVSRMSEVGIDAPGTARVATSAVRPQLDPITWRVDHPVDVVVETTQEHRRHVESMLGAARQTEATDAGSVRLTIPVTHRAAFRRRLYELGSRVVLLGPPDVRDEVRDELRSVVVGA